MLKHALALPLLGLLAGASVQPAPDLVAFESGMWETGIEVDSIDAPTLPPEARQSLSTLIEGLRDRQCNAGGAANPLQDFKNGIIAGFGSTTPGGRCEFQEDRLGGGSFSTTAICRNPDTEVVVTNEVRGSYTPSEFAGDFVITVRRAGAADGAPLARLQGRVSSRVTGPCPDPGA